MVNESAAIVSCLNTTRNRPEKICGSAASAAILTRRPRQSVPRPGEVFDALPLLLASALVAVRPAAMPDPCSARPYALLSTAAIARGPPPPLADQAVLGRAVLARLASMQRDARVAPLIASDCALGCAAIAAEAT